MKWSGLIFVLGILTVLILPAQMAMENETVKGVVDWLFGFPGAYILGLALVLVGVIGLIASSGNNNKK